MQQYYGAAADDWSHLDLVLGLTSDLLPVVSNPNAPISPNSNMKALGKTPSLYNRKREVVGIKDWTSYTATSNDISKWEKEPDYGICIQTRNIRAFDVDIDEMEKSARVARIIKDSLAGLLLPVRRRNNSNKCLFAFRLHAEMGKRILRLDVGAIELLATGQQFVAYGTHTSGVRYEWDWNGHTDFPELTMEQVDTVWGNLEGELNASSITLNSKRNSRNTTALAVQDEVIDKLPVIGWGPEGQAYIECPFKEDHTMDSGPTQTVYFPRGTRGYELGHFKCLHAHCAERNEADFLDAFKLREDYFEVIQEEQNTEEKKTFNIKIRGGHLHEEVGEAEDALLASSLQYYKRGDKLVRPVVEKVHTIHNRVSQVSLLHEIDMNYLSRDLCKVATWLKFDIKTKKWKKVNAPDKICNILLSDYGNWKFPSVSGIISTPTIRADGTLLYKEGFDPETGLILLGVSPNLHIPDHPTKQDAVDSLNILKELLVEFPFIDDTDRAVALSALITPVVRGSLPAAPMHIIKAPTPGSGKSFLLDVASAIAIGRPCPVMAAGRTEEETEKRLASAILAGQSIISIDNVNGSLGGDFLSQLIERPSVEVRILGKSQIIKIDSRSTVFANGNNIKVLNDMTRRVIMCALDAKEERPELRSFNADPLELVLDDRDKYVKAVLTIVRAYIAAGRPKRAPHVGSFKQWSDMVRSALMWLGEADAMLTMSKVREEDPVLQNISAVLSSMRDCIGCDTRITAAEMLKLAMRGDTGISGANDEEDKYEIFYNALLSAASSLTGRITPKELGKWLGRHKGRIVNGLRLEGRNPTGGQPSVWWVTDNITKKDDEFDLV